MNENTLSIKDPYSVNQITHRIERRISDYRLVINAMTTGPTGACSTAIVSVADCSSVVKMEIQILEAVSLSFLSFIG